MFKFNLPKWAAVDVQLPTGVVQRMIHLGDGEFISELPPLVIQGATPSDSGAETKSGIPVHWDSSIFGERSAAKHLVFAFDVPGAMAAVQRAEASGDVAAISMMQKLKLADADAEGELQ